MYKRKELCTSGRIKLPHRTVPADSKKHQITNQTAIIVTVTVTGNNCIYDYRRGIYSGNDKNVSTVITLPRPQRRS
jgi:hypothetical protein